MRWAPGPRPSLPAPTHPPGHAVPSQPLAAGEALARLSKVKKQDRAGKVNQVGWEGGLLPRTLRSPEQHRWPSPHPAQGGAGPPSVGRSSVDSDGPFIVPFLSRTLHADWPLSHKKPSRTKPGPRDSLSGLPPTLACVQHTMIEVCAPSCFALLSVR